MPTFNAYPASQVRAPDVWGAMQRGAEGAQMNQLRQMKIGQMQADRQRQNQLRGVMGGVGAEAGLGPNAQQALALDPSQLTALMKIPKAKRDQAKEQATALGNLALGVLTAPPIQRVSMWRQARESAIAYGVNPRNIPEAYDQGTEQKLRQWVAQAGQIKTLLDQVPDTPAGYQRTEGGLEFTPGGPADPAQARRLATAKRDPSGGGGSTALQKDVPYIAKLLGISKKEALALKMESKGKGYDAYLRDIAARYVSYGDRPERVYDKAKAVADLVYGRAQPPEANPDSQEGRNWLQELFGFGGSGETGSAKAAKRGSRGNPHTPETQADFGGIKSGEIYRDPDDQKLYRKP